ncbi:zinc finger protein 276 [Denticeps clupeoides]|uniref:Zinc finger protein 276 n=1 Tax=Denticeps clupeoides TaxID=299321 RepID=A0AAY4BTD8_9TELE|nr:zinc finger protein 276 [Denticeps clupeoides]
MKRTDRPVHNRQHPDTGVHRAGRRGRPRSAASVPGDSARVLPDTGAAAPTPERPEDRGSLQAGTGRLSAAFCRLCHGKFSPRRLRHAFSKLQGEPAEGAGLPRPPLLLCADFQRLLGVRMSRDPLLSPFVCKSCHAQFYKCHSVLLAFRRRVNLSPTSHEGSADRRGSMSRDYTGMSATPISSDPKCLHSLVTWAHNHAEGCRSCPDLKEVLEGQCGSSVRAVWGCVDGHSYVMDTVDTHLSPNQRDSMRVCEPDEEGQHCGSRGSQGLKTAPKLNKPNASTAQPSPAATPQTQQSDLSTAGTEGLLQSEDIPSPTAAQPVEPVGDSDLSDRNFSSDEEYEDRRKSVSSDELADSFPELRVLSSRRSNREAKAPLEPKVRRKPGPKPGWKKKIKSEREELPNIYKCPHQGCTAVYRGADGMKKHIKEHHEEVRERPCPHPGCNKVFMIDRYLQRHVKLIHTEERNYICDQCGQTFKQRKHLSVHQMRHSGAKPLQCEVCGFQCRQRASLKYHMTKHKAEADLEFACALCGKRFEKAHNLNVHMSMVHPLTQGNFDTPVLLHPTPEPDHPLHQTAESSTESQGDVTARADASLQEPQRTAPTSTDMSYVLASL